MSVPDLPWVVGPIPILITIFSAYVCGRMLARREVTSGGTFAAELFLCVGVISLVVHLLSDMDHLKISIFITQLLSTISCVTLALFINKIGHGIPDFPKQHESSEKSSLQVLIFFAVFVIMNTIIFYIPIYNKCVSAKCSASEFIFGSISHVFTWVYLFGFCGSLALVGVVGGLIQVSKK